MPAFWRRNGRRCKRKKARELFSFLNNVAEKRNKWERKKGRKTMLKKEMGRVFRLFIYRRCKERLASMSELCAF
jgi:hypothetical protein